MPGVADQPSYDNLLTNPNQRTPCVLVLDASGSMSAPTADGSTMVGQLNRGLERLEQDLKASPIAGARVQLAIVCVGGAMPDAGVMMYFTDAKDFFAFPFEAKGYTPLGRGLELALDLVEQQKRAYKDNGVNHTRPWIMVMTDGFPTDALGRDARGSPEWQRVAADCRTAGEHKRCIIYPLGVEGADMATLQQISAEPVKVLDQTKFVELFRWLSTSLTAISRSSPGDEVQLPSTSAWEAVKL